MIITCTILTVLSKETLKDKRVFFACLGGSGLYTPGIMFLCVYSIPSTNHLFSVLTIVINPLDRRLLTPPLLSTKLWSDGTVRLAIFRIKMSSPSDIQ